MDIYKPRIIQFETTDQLYQTAEDYVVSSLLYEIGEEGHARLAVSGGNTPLPLYKRFSDNPIFPWGEVEIFQTDERYVYPETDESNQKRFQDTVDELCLKTARELVFFDTTVSPEEAVKNYNDRLAQMDEPLFDVVILGIGSDGHFASLFPGGDYFGSQDAAIITKAGEDYQTKRRLSLTLQTILKSRHIVVLLTGDDKKHVVPEMLEGKLSGSEFPAKYLLAHPDVVIYQCIEKEEN